MSGREQWARAESVAERWWQVLEFRGAVIMAILLTAGGLVGNLYGWEGVAWNSFAGVVLGAIGVKWLRRIEG